MRGPLPETVSQELTVKGNVTVRTSAELQEPEVTAGFCRGDRLASADEFEIAQQGC